MEFLCRSGVHNGKQSEKSWGGLPVVAFFGDDIQLPPVLESPVYAPNASIPAGKHGALVWKEFTEAVILKKSVRQQGPEEERFREVLHLLRNYETSQSEAMWLQKFQWEDLKAKHGNELMERMSNDGLFIFPTRKEQWEHNKMKLLEANKSVPVVKIDLKVYMPKQ